MKKIIYIIVFCLLLYIIVVKVFDLIFTLGTLSFPLEKWFVFEVLLPDISVLILCFVVEYKIILRILKKRGNVPKELVE